MDDKILAESMAKRDALEASIVSEYDNEDERDAARQALAEAEGLDWKTGWPADYTPPDPETKDHDASATALSESAQVGNQREDRPDKDGTEAAAKAAEEEAKKAADDEAAKKAAEEEAAKKAEVEAAQAEAARQAEIKARDDRIAELEARVALQTSNDDARKEISEKVEARVAEFRRQMTEEDARIAKFEEDHGEEAAKEYRAQVEEARRLRAADIKRFEEAEIAAAEARNRQEADGATQLERDINANPDLRQWREDARANWHGDESKTADRYNLAVSIDAALRESAGWKDRPRQERFAEAVRMVKASDGASSPGSPGAQDTGTKPEGKSKEEIAAEIAKKAAADSKNDGLPGSLSDIAGGEAGHQTDLTKYAAMSMAEMADSGRSVAEMDAYFERHLVEAAEAPAGA